MKSQPIGVSCVFFCTTNKGTSAEQECQQTKPHQENTEIQKEHNPHANSELAQSELEGVAPMAPWYWLGRGCQQPQHHHQHPQQQQHQHCRTPRHVHCCNAAMVRQHQEIQQHNANTNGTRHNPATTMPIKHLRWGPPWGPRTTTQCQNNTGTRHNPTSPHQYNT